MSADSIQNTTIGWQLRLLSQRLGEWIELLLSSDGSNNTEPDASPEFTLPDWVATLLEWGALMLAALLIAWLIYRLVRRWLASRTQRPVTAVVTSLMDSEPERSASHWLREAQRLERAGDWRGACRALYMAALRLLSDRDLVPSSTSRTDQEYLQSLASLTELSQPRPYQLLIRTHERSHFGDDPLTAENLQRCRRAYQEIEKA